MSNEELHIRLSREQIKTWCDRHQYWFGAEEIDVMCRMPGKLLKRHLKKLSIEIDKKRESDKHPIKFKE